MFADRAEAAGKLALALEKYRDQHPLVLGIPRGGAETAFYIAMHLDAELSMLVSRKLGHPQNPEYAMGAIAEDGSMYLNPRAQAEATMEQIDAAAKKQRLEIQRRIKSMRNGKPLPDLTNRIVILADDGIATGATLFAAITMCKKHHPAKLIIAAPVSGRDMEERLAGMADEVVILEKPDLFYAVSQAYESFPQLEDEDVLRFMQEWEEAAKKAVGRPG